MQTQPTTPAPRRKWWLLIGGFVLLILSVDVLQRLIPSKPRPKPNSTQHEPGHKASPASPQVVRRNDGAVEIRHDLFRRSTTRLGNDKDEQALFECIEKGIEETFADGTEGWTRSRARDETERIRDECMTLIHPALAPVPPRPLQPGN
jgi:hypothetical protein